MREVAVTGVGLITPAGIGADATWRGLLTGRPATAEDRRLTGLPVARSCAIPGFRPEEVLPRQLLRRTDRFVHMALLAAREAVTDAGLGAGRWEAGRVGVVLGVSTGSSESWAPAYDSMCAGQPLEVSPFLATRTLPNMAAGEIAIDQRVTGPGFTVSGACASGGAAVLVARDLIRSGTCDVVLTGGSESACSPLTAVSFSQLGALSPHGIARPFDACRDGFVLGEGAGVLVLEHAGHARARGARVRSYLVGAAATADAHHVTAPHPEGAGAEAAMRAALADAGLSPADIAHVNTHGTATQLGDLAEARALRRVFPSGVPPVTALKSVIGHALGAAAGIEAAVTTLTLHHRTIPPAAERGTPDPEIDLDLVAGRPREVRMGAAMSTSFGFGGQNAVLVFREA